MAITPTPSITDLPPTPQRLVDAPAVYVPKADAFAAAWPLYGTQISAVGSAAEANGTAAEAAAVAANNSLTAATNALTLVSTCATSVTLSNAAKPLTGLQAGRTFEDGQRATLIRVSDPTSQGSGLISSFSGGTTLTLTIDSFVGPTGPFTDWILVLSAFAALPAATTTDIRVGTQGVAALSPLGLYNAAVEVALADAATVAVDMNTFQNAVLTLTSGVGATRALGAPTNAKPGQTGRIRVVQDGVGGRLLTYNAAWKREGGAGPLSTAANAVDYVYFDVITASLIVYNLVRSPA